MNALSAALAAQYEPPLATGTRESRLPVLCRSASEFLILGNHLLGNGGRGLLCQEKGEESVREINMAQEVELEISMIFIHVDSIGLGKFERGALSGIEEDAIKVRVPAGDGLDEFGNARGISDVEWNSSGLVGTMSFNKGIEAILPPSNDYDLGPRSDELLCHSQANARGSTDQENAGMRIRHFGRSERLVSGSGKELAMVVGMIKADCAVLVPFCEESGGFYPPHAFPLLSQNGDFNPT